MLRYMENAEHELVRALGFPRATTLCDIAFPRVHVACDFFKAVRYDDRLTIEARVEQVGRSSWKVAFTARFSEGEREEGEIAARGQMTMVAVDPTTERARPLPDDFRHALTEDRIT